MRSPSGRAESMTRGVAPVATRTTSASSSRVDPSSSVASTRDGETSRPVPRSTCTPSDASRSPMSRDWAAASARITTNSAQAIVDVRLSTPTQQPVSVAFRTVDGTAVAGLDYTPTNGVLNFPPGSFEGSIAVPLGCDALDEADEYFDVVFEDAGGQEGLFDGVGDGGQRLGVGPVRDQEHDAARENPPPGHGVSVQSVRAEPVREEPRLLREPAERRVSV